MLRVFLTVIFLITLSSSVFPGMLDDLAGGLGGTAQSNRPEAWDDQLGGYATGGSLHFRKKQNNLRLLTIDPPSFRMGCGGLDFRTGGLGYINGEQFINFIKSFATEGAVGFAYGGMLALKTLSPQISDLLDNIENIAREINSVNLNACKAGMNIADNLFSKDKASKEMSCQNSKIDDSGNFFKARETCSKEGEMLDATQEDGPGRLGNSYNLVWKALSGDGMPVADKEFLMTLSGTIISKREGESIRLTHKSGLASDDKLLNAVVFGKDASEVKGLKCRDSEKCLEVVESDALLTEDKSMIRRVRELLNSLAKKFLEEQAGQAPRIDPAEKHLVTNSSVPILKLLGLNAGLKGRAVVATVEDFTEAVAYDYVTSYFNGLLEKTRKALLDMQSHAVNAEEIIDKFQKELQAGKQNLFKERAAAFERLATLLSVKQRTRSLEKMVFSAYANYR